MNWRKAATKDIYKKAGPSKVVIVTIIFMVALVIALILALFWQNSENNRILLGESLENAQKIKMIEEHPPEDLLIPDLINSGDDAYPIREEFHYIVEETQQKEDNSYFDDAIFFGDSFTTGIPHYLETAYPNIQVVAERGINLYNVLTEEKIRTSTGEYKTLLEAAKEYGPRSKVYIMLGGNDLGFEEDVFLKGYKSFIAAVKEQYPDAIIYLQSITPVTGTESQLENYPLSNNKDINHYNMLIMNMAKEEQVYYVDVASAFTDSEGKLPTDASPDGVHFIGEYYYKWMDYLKKHTVGGNQ